MSDLGEPQSIFANSGTTLPESLDNGARIQTFPDEVALLLTPSKWRALDREHRFSAVVLTGSATGYKPLADHLDRSPDWVLTHLDHVGVVFRRQPAAAWTRGALENLMEQISPLGSESRVAAMTGMAANLSARGYAREARSMVDAALELDPSHAEAHVLRGGFAMATRDTADAERHAREALSHASRFSPALYLLTEALLAQGKGSEAFDSGERLLSAGGDRAANLFLFAKTARAVHHYRRESEALAELIGLAESAGAPVGSYRVFYGQALASDGKPVEALAEFEAAILSGELNRGELDFAANAAGRIRARLGK